ncbi:MAG TPA: ABC transporter ATP-binding protein [Thermoplasmata archaeon]|nr:ABC transporter ATP-binding protein [Thermoplasmata archaeon]
MATSGASVAEYPVPTEMPPAPEVEGPPAAAGASDHGVVLDIRDLKTYFFTYDGVVRALDGVSLKVRRGETTGLVGETGCGKSVTAFSVTRIIPDPPGRVISGKVMFGKANLLWDLENEAKFIPIKGTNRVKIKRSFRRIRASAERLSSIRGKSIATIFQEPSQAMNPIFSVADQLGEALILHEGTKVIDELLAANPRSPDVGAAIEALVVAAQEGDRDTMRAKAMAVGAAVNLTSFGRQAFYIARAAGADTESIRPSVLRAMKRLRLSGFQRGYLASQRRLIAFHDDLNQVHINEMVEGKSNRAGRRRLARRTSRERMTRFYYGIRGVHARVDKPLKEELFWRVVGLLEGVSIANPVQVARGYPHELSGGMLQRVMIAMSLSAEPAVLLADEPTTALDVTIQAQILELMRDLKTRVGTAIMLITHDLAVIAEVADRVCVMYAGVIVEQGPVHEVFRRPLHPYSQGLLASIPRVDQPNKELSSIPGSVPDLIRPPPGCRFHPRCAYAMPVCKQARPPMTSEGPEHEVACYLYKGPVAPE